MNITVEPRSYLTDFLKDSPKSNIFNIKLEENAGIPDILKIIGIPQEKIHLVLVNGKVSCLDSSLKDGDKVILYPHLMGG